MTMKRVFLTATIAILMMVAGAATAAAQAPNRVSANVKLPSHPRLLLLKGEEQALLNNIKADRYWRQMQSMLEREADAIIELEPQARELTGRRLLTVSREYLRRIFILSYVYRTTGKEEVLRHLKKEVLAACRFSDWNPAHYLDVAEMTLGVAIAYDWVYDKWSNRERKTIRNAIIEKGLEPSFVPQNEKTFNKVSNNWNPVCHAGLVFGALAVWENDRSEAAQVVNRALQNVPIAMKEYAPDGVYPEGTMYWEYATDFTVLLIEALQRALGTDYGLSQSPGFMKSGDYHLNMFTPSIKAFNYSDNDQNASVLPVKFWFFKQTGDSTLLYNEIKLLKRKGVTHLKSNRLAPTILLWGSTVATAKTPVPEKLMYVGGGSNPVAAMRSAWADNAMYLGVKLGRPSISHGHMDVGSFIIESQGVTWAADLGIENYYNLEKRKVGVWDFSQKSTRWDVYRYNPNSHNLVTFDQARQVANGTATFIDMADDPMDMRVTANLKPVYGMQIHSYTRTYALQNKSEVVITDNITTDDATTMTWNLMTSAVATKVSDKEVLLEKGKKTMRIKMDFNAPVTCEIADATPPTDYEHKNKGYQVVRFSSKLKANASYTITVTFAHDPVTKQ